MNIKIYLITILSLSLFLSSCKTKKNTIGSNESSKYKSSKLFRKLKKSNVDYEWYSFKSNATAFMDGMTVGGSTDIRIKKNELIWMSVKKFGFEVARVLIRPDSIFILDRFNKRYMAESIDYLKKEYEVPMDFAEIQDILVGNSIIKNQKPYSGKKMNQTYYLTTKSKELDINYNMDSKFRVTNSKYKNIENKTIEIDFSNYKTLNGKEIPYLRKYSFPNTVNPKYYLNLKLKKVYINKSQKIKFEIPKRYTKM